jgi:hypothetical protein
LEAAFSGGLIVQIIAIAVHFLLTASPREGQQRKGGESQGLVKLLIAL